MTRMFLSSLLPLLAVGARTLKGFRKGHPKIATPSHLADYKRMIKWHKYLALVSIPKLRSPGACFLLGLVLGEWTVFPDVLPPIVPSLIIIGAAKLPGGLKHDVETLPVENGSIHQAPPDW